MPWDIKQIIRKDERVPKCPECGGLSTVSHIVNDVFICTCGTIIIAEWVEPPKAVIAKSTRWHRCNLSPSTSHRTSDSQCPCSCSWCEAYNKGVLDASLRESTPS